MVVVGGVTLAQEVKPAAVVEESPDKGLSFKATLDFYSAYVWRGCVLNDRPVWQPGATASYSTGDYGAFSLGVWANYDMTERNKSHTFGGLNEIDYTVSYSIDVRDFSLEVGHVWYTFPKANGSDYFGSTHEVFGSVAYNNEIVTPSVSVSYDCGAVDGFYGNVALNKEVEVADRLTLGMDVSLGAGDSDYLDYYFGESSSGLMDFTVDVYASYALTDNVSIGAKLAWTSLIDSGARDNEVYWDEDILWGGINLAASF